MQNAAWEDRQRGKSAGAFNEARKPEQAQPAAERPKVQAAERHLTPAGYTRGTTPAAPVKQAKPEQEPTKAAQAKLIPSNDRTGFTLADLKAQREQSGEKAASRTAAEARDKVERERPRDNSRDRDDFER